MEVIPVALTDQQTPANKIRTRTFFIVDGPHDESVLKRALDSLIRDHWRKLGARLVTRPSDGFLEYHLPITFDNDYVLFEWSSRELGHSIDECPELKLFHHPPPAENGVTFLQPLDTLDDLVRPASWPYERKDEPPDAPMLYIHLSLFTDATVIAMSCPHVLGDQFGVANIMRAWFGLTRGENPPAMIGYKQDVLANGKEYADYPKHEISRTGRFRVRWPLEYFFVILGFIPELIMHPKEESHIVFFPRPYLHSLRKRFSAQLVEKYGVDPGLGSGDVLFGVLTKFARMHDPWARTMTLTQTINLRGRIPQLASIEQQHGFIHNSLYQASARKRVEPTTTASELAHTSRQIIMESTETSPKDLELGSVIVREMVRRGQGTHTCEPFDRSYLVSNWCAAWRGLDLSCENGTTDGGSGEDSTTDGEGKRMLIFGQSRAMNNPNRFAASIMCQTKEGFWCEFSAPLAAMALIRDHLKEDPMLEDF